jgi:hypothetical protein
MQSDPGESSHAQAARRPNQNSLAVALSPEYDRPVASTTTTPHETEQAGAPPPTPTPVRKLSLTAGWDAALTYDALRAPRAGEEQIEAARRAVFVGRSELVGSLVNAISRPDLRGTYLVSGYRGAGKTSLVIEAARQAAPRLKTRRLLPLVLNVSEVSASLDAASETTTIQPLGIDARRLLTALLRALRNELDETRPATPPSHPGRPWFRRPETPVDPLAQTRALVAQACQKAEATQYSRRAQEGAESTRTETRSFTRSLQVANVMKLMSAVALLAAAAVGGLAIADSTAAALGVVSAALAGVAIVSFATSVAVTRQTTQRTVAETEALFDNSLHQVESDLKTILAELDRAGYRTMFVLEELDKVKDEKGTQLDAVIRYFKNLFTQAPALFFFLTDKRYFDLVDAKLAAARKEGSYAVEHTFFTHRVFVSRPALEECLEYFEKVIDDDEARAAVAEIRRTQDARSRTATDMSTVECFLRLLLFNSQNHLFDLKSEMRRYVHIADDGRAHLEFDERSFPQRERDLAAFHFLLEQKLKLYWFGGGRDYVNEILRNRLSSVFADIGAEEPQRLAALYPTATEESNLRREDRGFITEAIDSLTDELQRGGAIETLTTPTDPTDAGASFRWRDNPVSSFRPSPKLESHEETLREQLERGIRVAGQFGAAGRLGSLSPNVADAKYIADAYRVAIDEISSASRPLAREEAQLRTGGIVRDLAPFVSKARADHQQRLLDAGWRLSALSRGSAGTNLRLVSTEHDTGPAHVLLVYGPAEVQPASVQEARASLGPGRWAVVLVEDDPDAPEAARQALSSTWRVLLTDDPAPPALVTVVALDEGLPTGSADPTWGERTTDELVLARLWLEQVQAGGPESAPRPAWLRSGPDERRFEAVGHALGAWLESPNRLLVAAHGPGPTPDELVRAMAEVAATSERPPTLLRPPESQTKEQPSSSVPTTSVSGDPIRRLLDAGRLIPLNPSAPPDAVGNRAVLVTSTVPESFQGMTVSTLRVSDEPGAVRAVAAALDGFDPPLADAVYDQAAERGDPLAMGQRLVRLWRSDDPANEALARELQPRLIATGDWDALRRAGALLKRRPEGVELLAAAAEDGDLGSIVELVVESVTNEAIDGPLWEGRLITSANAYALLDAARQIEHRDAERALRLRTAAADAGSLDAMVEVIVTAAQRNPKTAQTYVQRLATDHEWGRLEEARRGLEGRAPQLEAEIGELLEQRPR